MVYLWWSNRFVFPFYDITDVSLCLGKIHISQGVLQLITVSQDKPSHTLVPFTAQFLYNYLNKLFITL